MSFRINPTQGFSPTDGLGNVSVDLSEMTFTFAIQEFIGEPVNDWGVVVGQTYISSVFSKSLVESPNISQGSLSHVLGPGGFPLNWGCVITIPITASLEYDTEYTWRVDVGIGYNVSAGPGSTSFSSSAVTFTTESAPLPNKPTNPTPTDTDTGIVLQPTLSWEAG